MGREGSVQRTRGGLMTKLYRKCSLADVHEEDIMLPSYLGRVLRWWRRSVVNSRGDLVAKNIALIVNCIARFRACEKNCLRACWRDNRRLRFEIVINARAARNEHSGSLKFCYLNSGFTPNPYTSFTFDPRARAFLGWTATFVTLEWYIYGYCKSELNI